MAEARFTEADGYRLAADLLRDVREHYLAREKGLSVEQVEGLWKQDNSDVIRRYLTVLSTKKSPALERGFFAVLTDFIGSAADGAVCDPEFYQDGKSLDLT